MLVLCYNLPRLYQDCLASVALLLFEYYKSTPFKLSTMAYQVHLADLIPCPFCNAMFKKVGNHLPHCRLRDGRDYSHLLAPKTSKKRSQSMKKAKCLKCNQLFLRLDTHLRNSAMCKDISPLPSPITSASTNVCVTPPQPCQDLTLGEDSMLSLQNINPAVRSPDDALVRFTQTTNTFHTPHHVPQVKEYIKLPRIPEGWEEADHYFSTTLKYLS